MFLFLLLGHACTSEESAAANMPITEAWLEGADFSTGAVVGGVVSGDAMLFLRGPGDRIWAQRVALQGPVLALGLEVSVDPEALRQSIPLELPGDQRLTVGQVMGVYRGPAQSLTVGVGFSGRQLRNRDGVRMEEGHLAFGVGVMVALEWLRMEPGGSEDLSDLWTFEWDFVDTAEPWAPQDSGDMPPDDSADDSAPDDSADDSGGGDSGSDSGRGDSGPSDTGTPTSPGCDCSGSPGADSGSGGGDGGGTGGDPTDGGSDGGSSGCALSGSGGGSSGGSSGADCDSGCDVGGSCAVAPTRGGLLVGLLAMVALRRRR